MKISSLPILLRFFLASVLVCQLPAASPKKNVLIFFIDDLRPELGCYGMDQIKSPSIDRLASEGILFERAYCQQALCAPSRISMMTGQYPDNTGISDLFTPLRRSNREAVSLPSHFSERGYVTASFGKVYHHRIDDRDHWSELPEYTKDKYADPETLEAIRKRVAEAKKKELPIEDQRIAGKGPATEVGPDDDEAYCDGMVAKQAVASLRRNKDKPFFMCVGFTKPHLPFAAPKRYWDLYERADFSVPSRSLPEGIPDQDKTIWGELRGYRGVPKEGPLDDARTRELRHGYAACVSFADAQVGKVMAELERLGLRDETIVVLWGDHGYKLGEYGLWCKHTNLELDARVPLIVSAPGHAEGVKTKALVEIVDLFPTLVKVTGGTIPKGRDGRNLQTVLKDPAQPFRDMAFSQYPRGSTMGYTLRTDRWRYTEWINSKTKEIVARELYDHRDAPTAGKNLATEEKHTELVARLSKQLDAGQRIESSKLVGSR